MADHARAARMAKRIQTIVASAIESQVKDQRFELVTVTDARVTGDLHDATIFYTVRGRTIEEKPDLDAAAEAFHRARGQLRKIVGSELGVRFTPTLAFQYDDVPEASAHMEQLLARAKARDAELAKLKENAQPAGDANPYKTADEE
ncbi:30S ribosome-binding factor RbfA [Corynebacterium alimapuense]|uniref:Ribosome-binding factor A n=1 Tax=Corynebacterium alimapuense TaxID=1576874 RepID=A0A3M8K821_9CORY|nr:30S ribosome-binding factor RbfA [Corynebacterium alimapuense]RNE49377.1 30S ribosome-binding factor RbfA [Corynebacterium alimapuense]